jgi:hypothetical protein
LFHFLVSQDDLLPALIPNIGAKVTEEVATPTIMGHLDDAKPPAKEFVALSFGVLGGLQCKIARLIPRPLAFGVVRPASSKMSWRNCTIGVSME